VTTLTDGHAVEKMSQPRVLRVKEYSPGFQIEEALTAVIGRIDAKKAATILTQTMTRTQHPNVFGFLLSLLSAVAVRMDVSEVNEPAAILSQAITRARSSFHPTLLAEALSVLAGRMEHGTAATVCGQAAPTLGRLMKTFEKLGPHGLGQLARGLAVLAAHMEPNEAAAVCGRAASMLGQAMTRTRDWRELPQLISLTARMEPKESAAACAQAALALCGELKSSNPFRLWTNAELLSALAARMEPQPASEVCGQAAAALCQAMDQAEAENGSLKVLTSLTPYLRPKQAAEVAAVLSRVVKATKGGFERKRRAYGLSQVALRLDPRDAAASLNQALIGSDASVAAELAKGLAAVAARMDRKETAAVCAQAVVTLSPIVEEARFLLDENQAAERLSALAAHMEPKDVASLLEQARTKNQRHAMGALARGLAAAAVRSEKRELSALLGPMAIKYSRIIADTNEMFTTMAHTDTLSAIAPFVETKEAREAAAILLEGITTERLRPELEEILKKKGKVPPRRIKRNALAPYIGAVARSLSALAARLEAREAAEICGRAAAHIREVIVSGRHLNPDLADAALGLSALAEHMEHGEATAVCTLLAGRLSQAMSMEKEPNSLQRAASLHRKARGLLALAHHMEPKEADMACGFAAVTMSRALNDKFPAAYHGPWGRMRPVPELTRCLAEAATRMRLLDAFVEVAANLMLVMSKMDEGPDLEQVKQALSAVLLRDRASQNASRQTGLVGAVGGLTNPNSLFLAARLVEQSSAPLPSPLPAQTLVDLLKHPLCVGEARRQVLGQLSRHYQRPFADQWDFVRFARNELPGIDLLTPPRRPGG
jgi:hypothetical protein